MCVFVLLLNTTTNCHYYHHHTTTTTAQQQQLDLYAVAEHNNYVHKLLTLSDMVFELLAPYGEVRLGAATPSDEEAFYLRHGETPDSLKVRARLLFFLYITCCFGPWVSWLRLRPEHADGGCIVVCGNCTWCQVVKNFEEARGDTMNTSIDTSQDSPSSSPRAHTVSLSLTPLPISLPPNSPLPVPSRTPLIGWASG